MNGNRKWWVVAPMAALRCDGVCAAQAFATGSTASAKTLARGEDRR